MPFYVLQGIIRRKVAIIELGVYIERCLTSLRRATHRPLSIAESGAFLLRYLFEMKNLGVLVSALVGVVLWAPFLEASSIPKFGYAIPAGAGLSDATKATELCGTKDRVVLLPAWTLHLPSADRVADQGQFQSQILDALDSDAEVYLRVQVSASSLTGQESEKVLTDRVAQLLGRMPLTNFKVHGLLI